MTLYDTIVKNAKDNPSGIVAKYFSSKWSNADLLREADKVAGAVANMGVNKGDRVGVCLPNSLYLLSVLYGINKIGAVAVMLNPKSPSNELSRQLKMTECKGLIFSRIAIDAVVGMTEYDENMFMVCVPILPGMPVHIKAVLMSRLIKQNTIGNLKKKFKNAYTYNEFVQKTVPVDANTDDLADAVVIFSGGTNGTFKAVVHSSVSFEKSAETCLETEKPLPDVVSMLGILPAFHIFGLTVAIHLPIYAGGMVVLVPVFNMGILTGIIKKDCPAFFSGVPTIFERLLNYPAFAKSAKSGKLNFSKFRHGFVGGDNLTVEVRDEFNKIIKENGGDGYISMGYGMSECCPICVNNRESGWFESIGIPFDDMKVRILDENSDDELAEGEVGEITIASDHLMSYGFDEEGNHTEPYKNDKGEVWLRTGDIGYYQKGCLHYKCRQRRIIKVSGNTVFASSIEKILVDNLDIVKAAYVVPVPHDTRGYGAFAFVVTGREINDDELLKIVRGVCKDRLIPYAIPVGAAHIGEDEIERTALGKVVWGKLENKAKKLMN